MIADIAFSLAYLTVCPSVGAIDMEDLANLRLISEDMGLVSKLSGLVLSYGEKVLSFTNRL